jgi:hypothetical protein
MTAHLLYNLHSTDISGVVYVSFQHGLFLDFRPSHCVAGVSGPLAFGPELSWKESFGGKSSGNFSSLSSCFLASSICNIINLRVGVGTYGSANQLLLLRRKPGTVSIDYFPNSCRLLAFLVSIRLANCALDGM